MNTQDTPQVAPEQAEAATSEIIQMAINMAEMMDQSQKDQMVAVMVIRQTVALFTRDEFSDAQMICSSPFNEDYAIGLYATAVENDDKLIPCVTFSGLPVLEGGFGQPEPLGIFVLTLQGELLVSRLNKEGFSLRGADIYGQIEQLITNHEDRAEEAEKEAA